jgi:anhydro-N-acetylmuramic acid kinase
MSELFIGLMSGTSLDGVDGVLAEFPDATQPAHRAPLRVLAAATAPFDDAFRAGLLALNSRGDNELHRAALAANRLAGVYADVVDTLIQKAAAAGIAKTRIAAIGAHGQTVRHQPPVSAGAAASAEHYTIQLNNPALLAERTGLDVVADFRSRDVAARGQGAPLATAFHHYLFGRPDQAVTVLNLGGISNLTLIPPLADDPQGRSVLGFDCGAGNALMDAWCQQHTGQLYDAGGAWAASGQLIPELLASLLENDYFSQPPPKSTGRDLFSMDWLHAKLASHAAEKPENIQFTLAEFTVRPIITGVSSYGNNSKQLIVCGGGAFNLHLLDRLRAGLPGVEVQTSDAHGLPPLQVEAAAFAWLARQAVHRKPGNLASVTGAAGPRVLGAIYPA